MFDKVQTVIRSSSKPRSQKKKGKEKRKRKKKKEGGAFFQKKNTVSMENRIKNLVQQYRTFSGDQQLKCEFYP